MPVIELPEVIAWRCDNEKGILCNVCREGLTGIPLTADFLADEKPVCCNSCGKRIL